MTLVSSLETANSRDQLLVVLSKATSDPTKRPQLGVGKRDLLESGLSNSVEQGPYSRDCRHCGESDSSESVEQQQKLTMS